MIDYINDVKQFHDKFGLFTPDKFTQLNDELHKFRSGFFVEELTEYVEAVEANDFETALDSIIDLIYITAGASLLHGIQADEFYASISAINLISPETHFLVSDYFKFEETGIKIPEEEVNTDFHEAMVNCIDQYNILHYEDFTNDERHAQVKMILTMMAINCGNMLNLSGCPPEMQKELWDDVQRANMSKERAIKASDSKRGSTYDVIKPPHWSGPQGQKIIDKYQNANQ